MNIHIHGTCQTAVNTGNPQPQQSAHHGALPDAPPALPPTREQGNCQKSAQQWFCIAHSVANGLLSIFSFRATGAASREGGAGGSGVGGRGDDDTSENPENPNANQQKHKYEAAIIKIGGLQQKVAELQNVVKSYQVEILKSLPQKTFSQVQNS